MRLSVRSKILTSLSLIMILTIGHRLVSTLVIRSIDRQARNISVRHFETSTLVSQLLRQAQTVHSSALSHLQVGNQEVMIRHRADMQHAIDESQVLLERLEETCYTSGELEKIAEFHSAWNAYVDVLVGQVLNADTDEGESLMEQNGAASIAAQEAFGALDSLAQATRTTAENALSEVEHERRLAESVLLGLLLVASAISVLIAMYTASRIGSTISSIRNAARLVADGDLDWSVAVKTGDEIEDIAESLTKVARRTRQSLATSRETTEQLQRLISECRALEGLLTVEGNRLDTLLGLLTQPVIVTDDTGRIVLLNQPAAERTAWRREQALGVKLDEVLCLLDEATGERRPTPADEAVHPPRTVRHSKRAILLDKQGRQHPIILNSAPVLDSDNQISGTVIVFQEEVQDS